MRLLFQKLKNKAVLSVCLVLGYAFLIAVFACIPMFENGALNTLLSKKCANYIEENNRYPGDFSREGTFAFLDGKKTNVQELCNKLYNYKDTWTKYLPDYPVVEEQISLSLPEQSAKTNYGKKGNYLNISYMQNLLEHANILVSCEEEDGVEYQKNNMRPCYISTEIMDAFGFVIGEQLTFVGWKDDAGQNPIFYIAGIFEPSDCTDLFWANTPSDFSKAIFVEEQEFDNLLETYSVTEIGYTEHVMFDYTYLQNKNQVDTLYYISEFEKLDDKFFTPLSDILKKFEKEKKHIVSMLITLTIPMLGMILAFIYMVSNQLVSSEQGEIAMLKSRGISRFGILRLYLKQMTVLALFGFMIGEILGVVLTLLAAGATDFLTFKNENLSMYVITPEMLLYGGVAAVIGIIFVLIPVFFAAKISIVEQKKNYNKNGRMFWKKYFLDLILVGLSVYLLINYNRQGETLRSDALQGKLTDPLLFLNAVLFLFAVGLFTLRLIHYLVQLVYFLLKKKLKPAGYASFLQIIRNFKAQSFISLFLILTVSLGLFYANIARTLNANQTDRIIYNNGCDFVLEENWVMDKHSILGENGGTTVVYEYKEPDYSRYQVLLEKGLVTSMTRVMENTNIMLSKAGTKIEGCTLQSISTKEFGEIAYLNESLQKDGHWYHTLNSLAMEPQGIILSENLAKALSVSVGDSVNLTKYSELGKDSKEVKSQASAKVCAIVKAWPGYKQYVYRDGEMTEQYLAIMNYATAVADLKLSPYQIWCRLSENATEQEILSCLSEQGIVVSNYTNTGEDIKEMKQEPLMQITNGMFSLSFMVAILLCAVGFLIYWITSIRDRELLLGVYRAMGMTVNEINHMLVNEHIFSTLLSIVSGFGAGMLASRLFVNLFSIVYLPEKHNLSILICYEINDIIKLIAILIVVIFICLMVLRRIVKSLNITQALKIGED